MPAAKEVSIDASNGSIAENERSNANNLQKEITPKITYRCALSDKEARVLEVTILTLVILGVMALLTLPSALYFVPKVSMNTLRATARKYARTRMVGLRLNFRDG